MSKKKDLKAELRKGLKGLISNGPAGEFMNVPTVGVFEERPPAAAESFANGRAIRTRPWLAHEYIYIDGRPYQYTIDRRMGIVIHMPGQRFVPLIDFPTLFGRGHKIETPTVLRLSAHPIKADANDE
jgi:hypothetical protein